MSTLLGIDNVLFDVGDLVAAREHYARMGLSERFSFPGMALFSIGHERPGLLLREVPDLPESESRGPHIWIEVEDARTLAATLSAGDVREIRTGRVFEITDPWGNTLGFADYVFDPSRARTLGNPPVE